MKGLRWIVGLVVLVVIAVAAWQWLPGLRSKARDVYRKHGGWTEEARRDDPVGFLEYAEQKLAKDLAALNRSRSDLAQATQRIAGEQTKTEGLLASAVTLAESFRTAYKGAAAAKAWPVEVSGASYSKEQLVQQVRLILMQKGSYTQIIAEFKKAADAAKKKSEQLVGQVNRTKATLAMLPAKKEIARVNKLTEGIDDVLAQVNDLLGENDDVLSASPIRTVEELAAAKPATATPSAKLDADVKAFLEGGQ